MFPPIDLPESERIFSLFHVFVGHCAVGDGRLIREKHSVFVEVLHPTHEGTFRACFAQALSRQTGLCVHARGRALLRQDMGYEYRASKIDHRRLPKRTTTSEVSLWCPQRCNPSPSWMYDRPRETAIPEYPPSFRPAHRPLREAQEGKESADAAAVA